MLQCSVIKFQFSTLLQFCTISEKTKQCQMQLNVEHWQFLYIHANQNDHEDWGYIILLLVHFGDDIWVWAHGKEERGGEPQFGGSGNGRYNNFYRTIITINKGGLPSLKYVAKQYKYSPTCLQIFEIRRRKKNGCFIQMETELRHFSSLASFVFCGSCGNLFARVKKHH